MNAQTPSPPANEPEPQLYVGGRETTPADRALETSSARRLAERYRLEFVDLGQFSIDHELFRAISPTSCCAYGFVPH